MTERRAVILGGGVAGIATAICLSRQGVESVVLERDPQTSPTSSSLSFDGWERRGVPQFRHSHVLLARLRNILREHQPGLLEALLGEGAVELGPLEYATPRVRARGEMPGDDLLVSLGCRRSTFEWVLDSFVSDDPRVDVCRDRAVEGFSFRQDSEGLAIDAVYTSGGTVEVSGVVVDAMGAASQVESWLLGHLGPEGTANGSRSQKIGVTYLSLFYEGSADSPSAPGWVDLGWARCSLFPGDGGYLSVTLVTPEGFHGFKQLRSVSFFDALVREIPKIAAQLDRTGARPVKGASVQVMSGMRSRMRSHAEKLQNLRSVGDSAYTLNPIYGQGVTMAFLQAQLLGEVEYTGLTATGSGAVYQERCRKEVEPYFWNSVKADRSLRFGEKPELGKGLKARLSHRIRAAATRDPTVFRAYMRWFHMIETPMRAVVRPSVLVRSLQPQSPDDDDGSVAYDWASMSDAIPDVVR